VLHYQSIAMCLLLLPKLFGEGMRPQAPLVSGLQLQALLVSGLQLLVYAASSCSQTLLLPTFFFLEDFARILVAGLAAIYSAARLF
jgi:hypothetical protein